MKSKDNIRLPCTTSKVGFLVVLIVVSTVGYFPYQA
jgi:hypothetical protein